METKMEGIKEPWIKRDGNMMICERCGSRAHINTIIHFYHVHKDCLPRDNKNYKKQEVDNKI